MQKNILLLVSALILTLLVACSGGEPAEAEPAEALPAPAVSTEVSAAAEPTAVEQVEAPTETEPEGVATGAITGTMFNNWPGVVAATIYAVSTEDANTYFSIDTEDDMGGGVSYQLDVPAGSYYLYAYGINHSELNLSHFDPNASDITGPTMISVSAGETLADINIHPTSYPNDCRIFDIPAAPDGRYQPETELPMCGAETGTISGTIHNNWPGVVAATIYAVSTDDSSVFFSLDTEDDPGGGTPYSLDVPVGSYLVFGYAINDPKLNLSHNGLPERGGDGPVAITVAAGETLSDINLFPNGDYDECRFFDIPAAPDGRYQPENALPVCGATDASAENTANTGLTNIPAITAGPGGVISGQVCSQAPPNPPYAVYVMDQSYGNWAFQLVNGNPDGCAAFSISVPSGDYVVFAWPSNGSAMPASALTATQGGKQVLYEVPVTNEAGVQDLVLSPPGNGDCGTLYVAIPQTPDAKYPAESGDCR